MPNVFAGAVALIDRLIPASESRRRELQLCRSRYEHTQNAIDTASWIREAEIIAAHEWLTDTTFWIREAKAIAAYEWLSDRRMA